MHLELLVHGVCVRILDAINKKLKRPFAKLARVQVDRGQLRTNKRRQIDVVKANHRDIAWHVETRTLINAHKTNCLDVVCRGHTGHVSVGGYCKRRFGWETLHIFHLDFPDQLGVCS